MISKRKILVIVLFIVLVIGLLSLMIGWIWWWNGPSVQPFPPF
ncbi:MAG: hypothetical protein ACXAAO_07320 [Candidatus Thorarchaeota archaeon]